MVASIINVITAVVTISIIVEVSFGDFIRACIRSHEDVKMPTRNDNLYK